MKYLRIVCKQTCPCYHSNGYSRCRCLLDNLHRLSVKRKDPLKESVRYDRVASIMVEWVSYNRKYQKQLMMDWRRYASLCDNKYFLPSIGSVPTTFSYTDGTDFGSLTFCLNGLCAILGIRRDFMISVMKHPVGVPIRNHALHGKVGLLANRTKKLSPTYESLHDYFTRLEKEC